MKFISTLCLCLLALSLTAQQAQYSRAKIDLTGRHIIELAGMGLDVDHGEYARGRFLINDFSERELSLVRNAGFEVEILIEDVQKYYREQNQRGVTAGPRSGKCFQEKFDYATPENFNMGSMGGFFTYSEMLDHLDSMAASYPNLISKRTPINGPLTHEGRPIYWLRLSDNPEVDEDEPEVLYTALHHAREPAGMSQLIFYMWHLLENYGEDAEIQYLVENVEMYFVPCINPDGYLYNEFIAPDGGGMIRKNKRDNDGDGVFQSNVDGVDLNRNYGYEWGFDDDGSSPVSGSSTYRGPEPFSEPETQAMRNFCNQHEFRIALNYHTYGNLLIYPWGFSDEIADPVVFPALGRLLTQENNYLFGTGSETLDYITNGDADDWMYGADSKPAIFSMTPEVGPSGFWPAASDIEFLCKSTLSQNLYAALSLLNFGLAEDRSPSVINVLEGKLDFSLQRYGLADGDLTVVLNGHSSNVLEVGPAQVFNLFPYGEAQSQFSFTLSPDTKPGDEAVFILSTDNGWWSRQDTLVKIYGEFQQFFSEKADALANWAPAGDSVWGVSTDKFYSAPASITDSPLEEYDNNAENILVLRNPLDFTDATSAFLTFYASWDIEANYDYVQVSASTDGIDFTPLCGKYTKEGSIYQDEGQPVYDGKQSEWVMEEIDLADYAGDSLYLQFKLVSDVFLEGDGFYFDDLEVTVAQEEVVNTVKLDGEDFVKHQVFPNPADGYVIVELGELPVTGCELRVYNALGQLVRREELTSSYFEIKTAEWAEGVYFYQLDVGGELTEFKKLSVIH